MLTISYYDNVKDDVEGKKGSGGNFDTLKQAAQEHSEKEEEQEGDDTSIEILEDGLQEKQTKTQQQEKQKTQQETTGQSNASESKGSSMSNSSSNPMMNSSSQSTSNEDQNVQTDMSAVEERLDKIIEQNQRMIEILESFGT